MSTKKGPSYLKMIYQGLEEFFTSTPRTTFIKREIFEFLNKTFVFCDFDMDSNFEGIWNNYLWMILDYYAQEKNMDLTYENEQLRLTIKINELTQSIKRQNVISKPKYKDLNGFLGSVKCVNNTTP